MARAGAGGQPKLSGEANLEELDFLRTGGLRQAIHAREGGVCFYCLRRTPSRAHCLDHMVPLVEGGSNSYRNLVSCCMDCNSDKRGHTAADFLRRPYRMGRLSAKDLSERLRALQDLAAGQLRPHVLSEPNAGSGRSKESRAPGKIQPPLRNVLKG